MMWPVYPRTKAKVASSRWWRRGRHRNSTGWEGDFSLSNCCVLHLDIRDKKKKNSGGRTHVSLTFKCSSIFDGSFKYMKCIFQNLLLIYWDLQGTYYFFLNEGTFKKKKKQNQQNMVLFWLPTWAEWTQPRQLVASEVPLICSDTCTRIEKEQILGNMIKI